MNQKKICVIGGGRWGKNHIRTLGELGLLAGIVDVDKDKRDDYKKKYPNALVLTSVQQAIDAKFDGYTIATPANTHFQIASQLIAHGKHVLVEKPIALTTEESKTLAEAAKAAKVILLVGHVMLFHPAICKMKELIDNDRIGKLQYIYSNRLNLGTVRTEENILWSFAPHDISIFQYFIGKSPTEVTSHGGAFVQSHIHDTTMTVLSYPGNIVGHIFVSWLHPFKEHRLVIVGSKGMLSYEDSSEDKRLLYYEKGIDWVKGEPITRSGDIESIDYDKEMPLHQEMVHFNNRLCGHPPGPIEADAAVEVMDILERATQSLQ